jgi:hypothetical protein
LRGIAHEVNNPLRDDQLCRADRTRVEDDCEYARGIQEEGARVAAIVRNLLSSRAKTRVKSRSVQSVVETTLMPCGRCSSAMGSTCASTLADLPRVAPSATGRAGVAQPVDECARCADERSLGWLFDPFLPEERDGPGSACLSATASCATRRAVVDRASLSGGDCRPCRASDGGTAGGEWPEMKLSLERAPPSRRPARAPAAYKKWARIAGRKEIAPGSPNCAAERGTGSCSPITPRFPIDASRPSGVRHPNGKGPAVAVRPLPDGCPRPSSARQSAADIYDHLAGWAARRRCCSGLPTRASYGKWLQESAIVGGRS